MSSPDDFLSRHLRNPTTRFSNRAHAYHSSRPTLPGPVIQSILRGLDLPRCAIADLGAGTGLASVALIPFLHPGTRLLAIEPNADMRGYGERQPPAAPPILWLDATAESTTLPAASVDLVLSCTAFHWFHPENAPREVARILKPGGRLAIAVTDRDPSSPAAVEFHALMGEKELGITPANIHDWYAHAFSPISPDLTISPVRYSRPELVVVDNLQVFDLPRLLARAQSSSYFPADPMGQQRALEALTQFHRLQATPDGLLRLPYQSIALIATRLPD